MGWMSMTPTPRPLRPAPPRNTDAPSPGSKPVTDNPDLATPRPGLSDAPGAAPGAGNDIQPSVPTER